MLCALIHIQYKRVADLFHGNCRGDVSSEMHVSAALLMRPIPDFVFASGPARITVLDGFPVIDVSVFWQPVSRTCMVDINLD